MEHTIIISSCRKNKEHNESLGFFIEDHVKITQQDVEELALNKWKESHEFQMRDDRKYESELEKTEH